MRSREALFRREAEVDQVTDPGRGRGESTTRVRRVEETKLN